MILFGYGIGVGDYVLIVLCYFVEEIMWNNDKYKWIEMVNGWWWKDGLVLFGIGVGYERYEGSVLGRIDEIFGVYG